MGKNQKTPRGSDSSIRLGPGVAGIAKSPARQIYGGGE